MLTPHQRHFVAAARVAHLATATAAGIPHVVPVCFALHHETAYIAIDGKPKRDPNRLRRLANLAANPAAALTIDRWSENWARLAWVMLHGHADILDTGAEHATAQELVRARYPQMAGMDLAGLPVIALRITRAASWGDLAPDP